MSWTRTSEPFTCAHGWSTPGRIGRVLRDGSPVGTKEEHRRRAERENHARRAHDRDVLTRVPRHTEPLPGWGPSHSHPNGYFRPVTWVIGRQRLQEQMGFMDSPPEVPLWVNLMRELIFLVLPDGHQE